MVLLVSLSTIAVLGLISIVQSISGSGVCSVCDAVDVVASAGAESTHELDRSNASAMLMLLELRFTIVHRSCQDEGW